MVVAITAALLMTVGGCATVGVPGPLSGHRVFCLDTLELDQSIIDEGTQDPGQLDEVFRSRLRERSAGLRLKHCSKPETGEIVLRPRLEEWTTDSRPVMGLIGGSMVTTMHPTLEISMTIEALDAAGATVATWKIVADAIRNDLAQAVMPGLRGLADHFAKQLRASAK